MSVRLHVATAVIALAIAAMLECASVAVAADTVRVGAGAAPLFDKRTVRSSVVVFVQPGTELEVLYRDGDWMWVMAPPGKDGRAATGWVLRQMLANADPGPGTTAPPAAEDPAKDNVAGVTRPMSDLAAAAEAAKAAREMAHGPDTGETATPPPTSGNLAAIATKNVVLSTASSARPPEPVGGVTRQGSSVVGEWIVPRGLRGSLGMTYQSADVSQAAGWNNDRLLGAGGTVTASFAVLDPRIFTVDFAGDFQGTRASNRASVDSFSNTSGLQSYRLDLGVLTGRKLPLRLYADRVSSTSNLQPFGDTLEQLRRTRGLRTGAGFNWDMELDPALPHVQLSASQGRQLDERNYVFGYSSTNDERRAELRASRDYQRGRYDLHYTHGLFVYDVPDAGVRSETGSDVLLASGRLMPSARLTVDLHARGTRFTFGAGTRQSIVTGAGGDGTVRYEFGRHVAASASYAFSDNSFAALLSGELAPGQPGATPVMDASQLTTRTFYHDGEGRVEYSTPAVTAAVIGREVTFDVPPLLPPTLSALRTGGGLLRGQRTWRGLTLSAGADAAFGNAGSNAGVIEPYREMGVEAGVAQEVGRIARVGIDGSVRRTGRLTFFPVNLDARTATFRLETTRPGWARVRVSATRFDNLRDILVSDARDRRAGYSAGLAGGWYDLSADFNQNTTNSLMLAPGVLGSRPDVALLIASRPDLFRNLLAARDRSRVFGVQLRPLRGLHLQARAREEEQYYPGLFGFHVRGGQAWVTYQLRELQFELGWEAFDSVTSFGTVFDRRLYIRIRRDLLFF